MRTKRMTVLALTVAMGLSSVGTASAQSGNVAEQIRSRVSAAGQYQVLAVETPSDSKACRETRESYAANIRTDERIKKNFVRDLARQINQHGTDQIRVQVELIEDMGLLEAHASVGDGVAIRGVGFTSGGATYMIVGSKVTAEEQYETMRQRIERTIAVQQEQIAYLERRIEQHKKQGKNAEKAERTLEREQALLDDIKRDLSELTIEGATIRALEFEGEPAAILAAIGDDTIYTASVRNDPHKVPSVIRRIVNERDLSKAEAVQWLRDHPRAGHRMITRTSDRPDNGVAWVTKRCS